MASKSLNFLLFGEDVTAGKAFKKLGAEAEASGTKVKGAFSKGAMLGVAGLAVGLGEAVKAAGEFQQKTNVLVTAAGESVSNLGTIRKGIEDIAMSTGTSIGQLTDAAYVAEKAGYRGADALTLMKAAAEGAREEGAQLSTVLNAQTSIMASYHMKASDSVMVINMMKTAAGEAKTTMESFAGSLSTVLPVASANKISFADVAGSLATLTQHGTSADEATQELSNTIRNLAKPNAVAQKEMAQFGISANDVATKVGDGPGGRGLAGTLAYLSETVLKKMGPAGTVLLNTFNQSKDASAAAATELGALAPATQKVAKAYQDGTLSLKDWRASLKGMPADQAALASQWASTENAAKGFQSTLRSGLTNNQTYTAALGKMTGGVNGLNTTLQLTGESLAGTNERIKTIAAAAKDAGKDVDGWASTQKLFNVQMDMLKQRVEVAGIEIGMHLIPALSAAAEFTIKHQTAVLSVIGALTAYKAATIAAGVAQAAFAAGTALVSGAVEAMETVYIAAMIAMDSAMGPVGIAIAAITVAVGVATKGFGLFGGGAHSAVKPVQELTSAIIADGDAVGKLTQAQINNKLSSTGAYDAALKLGISQSTVLAATMGNVAAQRQIKAAVDAARASYDKSTQAINTGNVAARNGHVAYGQATQAQRDAKAAADKLASSTGVLTSQLNASKHAADNETIAAKGLAQWLSKIPQHVKTTISVDTSSAYQNIRQVIDYANNQTAVIHVTATNPITGGTMGGRQAYASGTNYVPKSGMYTINEQGQERVFLPKGSQVQTASATRMASGGGSGMSLTINITSPLASKDDIARAVVPALANFYKRGGARP